MNNGVGSGAPAQPRIPTVSH